MDVELPPDIDSEMEFDTDIESADTLIPFNCADDISEIELPPDVDGEQEENLNGCACKGITCFKKFGKQELMQMRDTRLSQKEPERSKS